MTDAALHDSNKCIDLLEEKDKAVYADSAYSGSAIADNLPENCKNCICEKGYRNRPMAERQKASNREKSKIRCRIEHVFGFMTGSMNGITVHSIGLNSAWFNVGLTNLIYNIFRYEFLKRPKA